VQPVTRRGVGRVPLGGVSGVGAGNAPPKDANVPPSAPTSQTYSGLVVTGEEAIKQSKAQREQQDVLRVHTEPRSNAVKRVAEKTFYLVDGVWTDSEFKADARLPETVVTFGSDEYFALLKQNPKLASYFSLGERVVVIFEGRVYKVNAPAP
jgi:hypothetical protein